QLQARLAAIAQEAEELTTERLRGDDEHAAARRRLTEALEQMDVLADERERRSSAREQRRAALDQARAQAQTDRDAAHAIAIQIESMRTARGTTQQNLDRMRGQQAHLRTRREQLRIAL